MGEVEVMDVAKAFEITPKSKPDNSIIHILEDQRPHSMAEIASLVNISADKVESFVRFLAKYGIVTYGEERKEAIICADFLSLKEKEEEMNLKSYPR
jgi:predicted transcriptional regulator